MIHPLLGGEGRGEGERCLHSKSFSNAKNAEAQKENIQHPTSNDCAQRLLYWMLGVRCWLFDVSLLSRLGVGRELCNFELEMWSTAKHELTNENYS
jgi:hypothetical protein